MTACGGNFIGCEIRRNQQCPPCGLATIEPAGQHRYVDRNEATSKRKRAEKMSTFKKILVLYLVIRGYVEGGGVYLNIVEHEGMSFFGEWLRGKEKGSLDNKAAWNSEKKLKMCIQSIA